MSVLGVIFFVLIFLMAFWMLALFLFGFVVPTWITLGFFRMIRPKRVFDEEDED
ncbi:MAG: hypothetical protein ABI207_05015 [Crocinitomicaceae bacterium]